MEILAVQIFPHLTSTFERIHSVCKMFSKCPQAELLLKASKKSQPTSKQWFQNPTVLEQSMQQLLFVHKCSSFHLKYQLARLSGHCHADDLHCGGTYLDVYADLEV